MEKLPINRSQKIRLVSIVIPVFNERKMIETKIGRVQNVEIPKELIIVDDGSTDGTREWLLKRFGQGSSDEEKSQKEFSDSRADCSRVRVLTHQHNQGKGAALKTGFLHARGSIVIVQDADLEYSPENYHRLMALVITGCTDVVYGSWFLGGMKRKLATRLLSG